MESQLSFTFALLLSVISFLSAQSSVNFSPPAKCTNSYECQGNSTTWSNPYSICEHGKCTCPGGLTTDQKCKPWGLPLGYTCNVDTQDCGYGAYCGLGQCRCLLGYVPSTANEFDCVQVNCTNQAQCATPFGANVECRESKCQCSSSKSIALDWPTQKCVPKWINACHQDSDCVGNSTCIGSSCRCAFGSKIWLLYEECHQFSCSHHSDCNSVVPYSQCMASQCECMEGFSLNTASQECSPNSTSNVKTALLTVGLTVLGIGVAFGLYKFGHWRGRQTIRREYN